MFGATLARAFVLFVPLQTFFPAAVHASAVQLIDPQAQLTLFDDFYRQVLALGAQKRDQAVPWRVFPPTAFKRFEPYELAAYVKLSHIGLSTVYEDTKVELLIEIFPDDVEQLQALFEHGVAPLVHVIRVSIPEELAVEGRVEEWTQFFRELRGVVRRYGGNAEIWVQRTHQSLTDAERLREYFLLRYSGADKVNVSSLLSIGLRPTDSSLLALVADVSAAKQLEHHTLLGRVELGVGIWAFVFARDGIPLLVIWSEDGVWTLELPGVTQHAEVVNLYGQTTAAVVQHDRLRMTVGAEPMYVRGLDAGWVARAFLESGAERIGTIIAAAAGDDGSASDVAEIVALTYAIATDIWRLHASEEQTSAQAVGREIAVRQTGWQPPSVMAPFETERPPSPDPDITLARWEHIMTRLFSTSYRKAVTAPERGAWRWGELDALPLFVELIAAFGHPWGGDEAQGYVAGTGRVVREAALFLQESGARERQPHDDAATPARGYRFETHGLLDRAFYWLQRAEASQTEAAAAAWALIARETAALAVERSVTEAPLPEHSLLAAPFIELEHRLGGLTADNGSVRPLDVPLFGVFVRDAAVEGQTEWQLRVDAPPEWLWQVGAQAARLPSGEKTPVVVPASDQPALLTDSLGLVPLHLRLLVPSDTPAGRYPVHISLIDPAGGLDAITLYVMVR